MAPGESLQPADGPFELELLTASLRADAADLGTFVESLAVKLEDAIPGLVRVDRARSGLRGPKKVRRIVVDAGGERLELVCEGGNRVQARRARVSGGITLKTEPLDIEPWLQTLSSALADEAGHSERTRQALERLLLE
jgi:hypothetical protein